jgi:Fe-S-cluster containining protein
VAEALGREVRAQTVKTLAETRRPDSPAPDSPAPDAPAAEASAADALAPDSSAADALAEAGRAALAAAETAFAELQARDASVRREVAGLDCRKYCAHCCYKKVSATPAEVFHLARYLAANLSAKALAKLKARLGGLDDKTRGMSPEERGRARLPCALLVGRLCIAHPARPASCRGFNSRDVGACERALKRREVEIPVYAPQYRLFGEAHLGLRAGLAESGLASTHLELTRALRIALETPDAATRYLAGEPVFRAAEQD